MGTLLSVSLSQLCFTRFKNAEVLLLLGRKMSLLPVLLKTLQAKKVAETLRQSALKVLLDLLPLTVLKKRYLTRRCSHLHMHSRGLLSARQTNWQVGHAPNATLPRTMHARAYSQLRGCCRAFALAIPTFAVACSSRREALSHLEMKVLQVRVAWM